MFGRNGNTLEPAQINVEQGQDQKQERKKLLKAMEGLVQVNQWEEIRVRTALVKYFFFKLTIAEINITSGYLHYILEYNLTSFVLLQVVKMYCPAK